MRMQEMRKHCKSRRKATINAIKCCSKLLFWASRCGFVVVHKKHCKTAVEPNILLPKNAYFAYVFEEYAWFFRGKIKAYQNSGGRSICIALAEILGNYSGFCFGTILDPFYFIFDHFLWFNTSLKRYFVKYRAVPLFYNNFETPWPRMCLKSIVLAYFLAKLQKALAKPIQVS